MRLKLSVFIGVVLCLVLMGMYGVLSRMFDSRDGWRPNDVYSLLGGASYSTVSYSSSSSQFGGMGAPVVPMRGGNSFSRRAVAPAFSYAPAYRSPMTNGSLALSPNGPIASSPQGALYTTSSATMKSFGGGNVSSSAFAGAANGASPASAATPVAASVGMPSVNMPAAAYGNTRLNTNELAALMSGDAALSTASAYAGIGNTTAGGPMGIRGRRNAAPGMGGQYFGWLTSWWGDDESGKGWAYNTGGGITIAELQDLFYNMTGQTHFQNPDAWTAFYNWFMSQMNSDGEVVYGDYTWYLPLSDAIPFVLLLSLLYAWFIYRKTKKQTI